MELRVWGAGSGKLSKRYTDLQCHYRIAGNQDYSSVPMAPISETRDLLAARCVIPALHAKPGDRLDYYIDMKLDGVYSKKVGQPIPFV